MFAVAAVIEADGHGVRAPWMGPALIKYKESVAKMPQDIQRFTEIAQAALDNDGSKSLK
ncbi:hypothetical protein GA0115261_1000813 [Streptomyces sp. OspMP-M43]|nr:hypothetical protein GA0115261_1000813 [Streptomyces sp. OspMP-M43]